MSNQFPVTPQQFAEILKGLEGAQHQAQRCKRVAFIADDGMVCEINDPQLAAIVKRFTIGYFDEMIKKVEADQKHILNAKVKAR
jgi:hypothetical protein